MNLAGKAGDAFAPALIETHPLTLLALNANDAHMALTAGHTSFVPYVLVSLARRIAEDPLYFYLGNTRFAEAVTTLDSLDAVPNLAHKIQRSKPLFARFAVLAVLVEPGAVVCLLAGWSQMRRSVFWSVNVFGTVGRILLVRALGRVARRWSAFATLAAAAKTHRRVIAIASAGVASAAALALIRGCFKVFAPRKGGKRNRTPHPPSRNEESVGENSTHR